MYLRFLFADELKLKLKSHPPYMMVLFLTIQIDRNLLRKIQGKE